MDGMKTCTKCGEAKALSMFPRNKDGKDGRRNTCKDCWNQRCFRDYYRDRPEADMSRAVERAKVRADFQCR